jgi:hypothetical protein
MAAGAGLLCKRRKAAKQKNANKYKIVFRESGPGAPDVDHGALAAAEDVPIQYAGGITASSI